MEIMKSEPTRRPDGRYLIWVRVGPGPKGRVPAYGPTAQAARERATVIRQAYADESTQNPAVVWPVGSFAEFLYKVWTPHVYPGIKPTTMAKYDGLVVHHLLPAPARISKDPGSKRIPLAEFPIASIGYDQALDLRNSIRRHDGRPGEPSNAQVAEVVYRFREIMGLFHALEGAQGRFVRRDWALVAAPAKPKKKKRTTPPESFTLELLKVATPAERGAVFGLGVLALRRGEFCGLLKSKIDREAMTLTVDKQRHPLLGDGPADTKGEERIIPLTAALLAKIDELKDPRSVYVFTDERGRPWRPNAVTDRIPLLCERAGVKRSTPHDLRSYAASNLALLGHDLGTIMEILGHTELDTTMIYVNSRDAEKRQGLDQLLSRWNAPEEAQAK